MRTPALRVALARSSFEPTRIKKGRTPLHPLGWTPHAGDPNRGHARPTWSARFKTTAPHGRGGGNLIKTIASLECEKGGSPKTMVAQSLLLALATALSLLRPTPRRPLARPLFSTPGKDGARPWRWTTARGPSPGCPPWSLHGPGQPPWGRRRAAGPGPGLRRQLRADSLALAPPI